MQTVILFVQRHRHKLTAVSLFTLFLSVLLFSLSINTASAANIIVTANNPQGWGFLAEDGATGVGEFVLGPDSPPGGSGSVRLSVSDNLSSISFGVQNYANTPLTDIQAISYNTYRTSASSNALAVSFQMNVDFWGTVIGGILWQGRLVYEPYRQGIVPATGTWETWDAINSGNAVWWLTSGPPGNTSCLQNNPCTWDNILTTFPDARIHPHATMTGIGFKVGSGWAAFDGNINQLSMQIDGTTDVYTFGPPVHNITQMTDYLTIQDGIDAADAEDVITVDPGFYIENVVIDKSLTLRGSGAGVDRTLHTILDGTSLSGIGIAIDSPITDVTIDGFRVQNFMQSGIRAQGGNDYFTAQNLWMDGNGRSGTSDAGLYINGPVDTVFINNVEASNNDTRGIVIWNGHKSNITITNNNAHDNGCCGIELQDGTASGVTMTGNTSANNGDSGMSAMGLTSGDGANLIADNTVTNNGRFGIEIKNPDGTGAASGDGSIIVENNIVSFTANAGMNVRDHGGIVVFRRDFYSAMGYVDIPTGVIVRNNTVSGYAQQNPSATTSEGFGIVIEGVNHTVSGNTLQNNDIGIQEQGGQHPNANYVPNNAGNGDQADGQSAEYFGRGNAPTACRSTVSGNIFSGNTTDYRIRVTASGNSLVTNTNTGEQFCTIQTAVDDTDTLDGHTLQLAADTYAEEVHITKALTITGDSAATTTINPSTNTGVNNDDLDAWWLVDDGVELHLSNMTFDGTGYLVSQAIRHKGEGSITNVDFTEIKYNPSTHYRGIAVAVRGTGPVYFTNIAMSEIGRIGIHFGSSGVNGSVVDNLSYTGKGTGDFLDYGVELGWGAQATIQNSQFSAIRGVADSDGSDSACVFATTYFGAGTEATIINSDFSDCSTAVYIGYDTADTTVAMVTGSTIDNVGNVFATTSISNTLTAYANNISNFTNGDVISGTTTVISGTVNTRHNWWGTYASQPVGVDNDSWAFLLGAAVNSWADGTGTVTLADGIAADDVNFAGNGRLVIVNHGSGSANAPFGKNPVNTEAIACADFYDFFAIDGSGSYDVSIPVDGVACAAGTINDELFEFALNGSGEPDLTCSPDSACWDAITATRSGDLLTAVIPAADLEGTPFTTPNVIPSLNLSTPQPILEGDSGSTPLVFTVTLSIASSEPVTVTYATADETAVSGTDYTAISGTITFNPGETVKNIAVPVLGDIIYESDETFMMTLSDPVNATLAYSQTSGTIQNDDPAATGELQFSQGDYAVIENMGVVTITVVRTGGSSEATSVDYATSNGTADGNDYTTTSGTLNFADGETIKTFTISITDDGVTEPNETVNLELSNVTNGAVLGLLETAVLTITQPVYQLYLPIIMKI